MPRIKRVLHPWEKFLSNRTVRTPLWVWALLARRAVEQGTTASGLARRILEDWAARNDDGAPTQP